MLHKQEQPRPFEKEVGNPASKQEVNKDVDNVRYLVTKQKPKESEEVTHLDLRAVDVANDDVFVINKPYKIYVQLTNEDIAKSATLLADYFTHNVEARNMISEKGIKAFGKDFDLTSTLEERAFLQNRSFLTKVVDAFRKNKNTGEKGVQKDVQPEMIKAYASFFSHYLEHHPEIIGEIESKTGKIIGSVIGNAKGNRAREGDHVGIAV